MNHLLQVARRTGKSAVGFKIQLVIHRMNAHLSNFNGAELVAVMTRHKKKATTKSAPYQSAAKEVVWGDILPFSCTLYMAKTGLFQAKLFQIHIFDTRNDQNVATFEFDLAELVQSDKDSGKETITVATSKCQDPRASLSITVISSRVLHFGGGGRKGSAGYGDHEGSEVSFDGSRSELSVSTITSATSSHHQQPHHGKVPVSTARKSPDHAKANVLRGAFPAVHENENDEQEGVETLAESPKQNSKHQELVRTIEDLENQLRLSESTNVRLEKAIDEKELKMERLRAENEELGVEVEGLRSQLLKADTGARAGRRSTSDGSDGVMQVDFIQYMSLKEENDKLLQQLEAAKAAKKSAESPSKHSSRAPMGKDEEDANDDSDSEASSANEYMDAQEPQLLAEISDLKHSVSALSDQRDELNHAIASLQSDNKQLCGQVEDLTARMLVLTTEIESKDEALALAKAAAALPPPAPVNEIGGESDSDEQEARMSEVTCQNEKLVQQLGQLDGVVTKLMTERTSLLDKLGHAETANERARDDVESAQQTIAQLREQVQEISAQLTAAQQDLLDLRHGELAASVAATAEAVAKNKELYDRLTELSQQNDELQTRLNELEEKLTRAEASGEARETELQCQIQALKHEAETLRGDLEELRTSKQQAEDELLERTAALKDALEAQRRLEIGHDEERTQLAMNNEEMRVRVEQTAVEAQTLSAEWRQKVETLEQENDYFQRELIDSKMKLAELTQQNDELAAQNKKMEKSVVEMKIHAAERDLKAAKKK